MSTLNYTGVGVVRRFNPLIDMVAQPQLFNTPVRQWVSAEIHWTTGFEALIFESAESAKRYAEVLGVPFIDKMAARKRR